jgi:hypothetical protein
MGLNIVPAEHDIGTFWAWQELVEALSIWFRGQSWQLAVLAFQYGLSDAHLEQDLETEFQIGVSGGHNEFSDPGGCTEVMFSQTRVVEFSCWPVGQSIVHWARVGL